MGISFIDVRKNRFLFAFSPTKLLATSSRFIASVIFMDVYHRMV